MENILVILGAAELETNQEFDPMQLCPVYPDAYPMPPLLQNTKVRRQRYVLPILPSWSKRLFSHSGTVFCAEFIIHHR